MLFEQAVLVGFTDAQLFPIPAFKRQICEPEHPEPPAKRSRTQLTEGSKRLECPYHNCNRTFNKLDHLKTHQRTHTGEKPYQCKECGKGFGDLANLKRHIRIHTGEKPFKCSYEGCDKAFSVSSNLKQHHRTHTGEKPYRCPVCDKSFSHVSSRKKHMVLHKGEMGKVEASYNCDTKCEGSILFPCQMVSEMPVISPLPTSCPQQEIYLSTSPVLPPTYTPRSCQMVSLDNQSIKLEHTPDIPQHIYTVHSSFDSTSLDSSYSPTSSPLRHSPYHTPTSTTPPPLTHCLVNSNLAHTPPLKHCTNTYNTTETSRMMASPQHTQLGDPVLQTSSCQIQSSPIYSSYPPSHTASSFPSCAQSVSTTIQPHNTPTSPSCNGTSSSKGDVLGSSPSSVELYEMKIREIQREILETLFAVE